MTLQLEPTCQKRLAKLCGQFNEHIKQLEKQLNVDIQNRGHAFYIKGEPSKVEQASRILHTLYDETDLDHELTSEQVHILLQENQAHAKKNHNNPSEFVIHTKRGAIKARSENQSRLLKSMREDAICFAVGPAGTGKTYLAVAYAVHLLNEEQINKIILVRPVVEAGESLGFLPGDLAQKIDPYLRPLYDALDEMMGQEKVAKLIERGIIEIAPLAYMRGRTLNDAFVILDESQNCTKEQMKMFLTRIGFGTHAVITGDLTQVDLPKNKLSGLRHAIAVLEDIEGICFNYFDAKDVVRHPLIEHIIQAYEKYYHRAES